MDYARAMGNLENFTGMLAAFVAFVDALSTLASDQTSTPVLGAGSSLGGWAVNLHRTCFDIVDRYVPIFAGSALGEMFVSSVSRKMTARSAKRRPEHLRKVLDFEPEFRPVGGDNCAPLLARYDSIIEYDRQRSNHTGMPLTVLYRGHVTCSLTTAAFREHVLGAIPDTDLATGIPR